MRAIVQSINYNQASDSLKYDIAVLLHRVWPENSPMPKETIPSAHGKELHAHSFYLYVDGKLVSYAGVVHKTIKHEGNRFNIVGLSCVATDPDYRNQGFGHQIVAAATRWIEKQNNIDFGVFTCEPGLASFYQRAGAWAVVPDVILIGNKEEDALSSELLNIVVLMRLFTEKSREKKSILRQTTINLDFPEGEFL